MELAAMPQSSPHVAADMLQPLGMLTGGLFPQLSSDDLSVFLESMLADGYARADSAAIDAGVELDAAARDDIALAWAYHRAYESVWQRLSATPATAAIDGEASRTYLGTQITAFEKLKDQYFTLYARLAPVVVPTGDAILTRGTSSVPNRFVW